jgi:TolB-like protein/Tfp pilus assembly protein PilF
VTVVVVGIISVGWWYWASRGRAHSQRAIRSLVVLPLVNLSGDASRQYLADGITDALITDLAGISALRVVSRASAMSYQTLHKTAPEIGRELGVDAVLESSMTYEGERVRVNAKLVLARSDDHLWAASFERQERDVLRLESEITGAIAREIRVRILPEEQRRLQSAHAMKPEAYDAYIKGRFFISRWTQENWQKARSYFQEAVSKDPGSALAYAGLAAAYCIGSGWAMAPNECGPKCKEAAETALAIDPSVAEAHRELGAYYLFYAWNWPAAAKELRTAVELNPANPISHEVYGYYLYVIGAMDEALREHQLAVRLNPVSLISNTDVGDVFYYEHQYDKAIQQYRKTLDLDPNFAVAREHLGKALVQKRMFPEAIAELQAASKLEPKSWTIASLGYALASASRSPEALRLIDELKSQSAKQYVSPLGVAVIYIGLHKPELAMEWLEKAYQERTDVLVWLKRDPIYDPIRAHRRFQALVRRMALP